MKKFMRIASITFATIVIGTTSAFAFPGECVIFDDEAFDLELLMDQAYSQKIEDAFITSKEAYYSLESGKIFRILDDEELSESEKAKVLNVTFVDKNGNKELYENLNDTVPEKIDSKFEIIDIH